METDFLVIGSGIAGLNYALEVSKFGKVVVVTKKDVAESNTNYAQGGIASVLSPKDSFDSHIQDTIKVGSGLSNKKAVKILVESGPKEIKKLMNLGVRFTQRNGVLSLGREGGHSTNRIVFSGDHTGHSIESVLVKSAKSNKNITILESAFAKSLIVKNGRCYGADVFFKNGLGSRKIFSKATMIASGGIGQVYKITSNPNIATGDGIAMAYRAGCEVVDMEFVQFHPTALNKKTCPHFLLSETLRGEGAILVNSNGERFMNKYSELGELAPRDVVSRAVFEEMKKGKVYLDITHKKKNFIKRRFPMIYNKLLSYGINMTREKVPISPAAHYICGGIKINLSGETNIEGLFASGECSCSGVHGANRLASNSLLESLVFSTRAANASRRYSKEKIKKPSVSSTKLSKENFRKRERIRKIMWDHAGIIRNKTGLQKALEEIKGMKFNGVSETGNIALVSELILKSALLRKESRGTHYRSDYPIAKNIWRKHIVLSGDV